MIVALSSLGGFAIGRLTAPSVGVTQKSVANHAPVTVAEHSGTVTEVIDGDTVRVAIQNWQKEEERVRLAAIDTPERGQQWFAESRAALSRMVKGQTVRLQWVDSNLPQRDQYGRLLVYLFVDDQNINVEMVRQGWSPYISKYGEGRYHLDLARAEDEARMAHRGIWASRP
jgi:endonuclease YncB( thermonuclease family)